MCTPRKADSLSIDRDVTDALRDFRRGGGSESGSSICDLQCGDW